ncbi:hypothetical protein COO60DRAFT_604343 [Scenedesmus sp. NREL 46B-D3]|nr:hypothetical protein COO60DRAFT_604343 [Scenedesmus sp. NREL 46B-D3]
MFTQLCDRRTIALRGRGRHATTKPNCRQSPQAGAAAGPAPQFVKSLPNKSVRSSSSSSSSSGSGSSNSSSGCMYDVVVAGGTLGVFMATALAVKGWRVAVVERGRLQGRTQEWNISRKELQELEELGLLTAAEAESCIALEFNPVRVGFHGGTDVWTRDVLNLGVKPDRLVALMRRKLEAAGGKVYEDAQLGGVEVLSDGVGLVVTSQTVPGGAAAAAAGGGQSSGARVQYASSLTTRLLLDCMGHASPVVRQLRCAVLR